VRDKGGFRNLPYHLAGADGVAAPCQRLKGPSSGVIKGVDLFTAADPCAAFGFDARQRALDAVVDIADEARTQRNRKGGPVQSIFAPGLIIVVSS